MIFHRRPTMKFACCSLGRDDRVKRVEVPRELIRRFSNASFFKNNDSPRDGCDSVGGAQASG
jgi:hypothetical protein